jgi:hypothetical protein
MPPGCQQDATKLPVSPFIWDKEAIWWHPAGILVASWWHPGKITGIYYE